MESFCRRMLWSALPLAALLAAGCGGKNRVECGNGEIEVDINLGVLETCDDGNTTPGDGCDANCQVEFDAVNHACNLPAGFQNGLGGCCNVDTDCAGNDSGVICLGGFCSLLNCQQDSDCQPQANTIASPFPEGTQFQCADFSGAGLVNFCLPGSLQPCGNDATGCPDGETCALGINENPTNPALDGVAGLCTTTFLGAGEPGSFCTGNDFECGGVGLFASCLGNTCTSACNGLAPDGGDSACGDGLECVGPLIDILNNPAAPVGGGGFCVGNSCGGQSISLGGADESVLNDNCAPGFSCDLFGFLNSGEDFLRYQCQAEDPNGAGLFATCEQDPFFEQPCAAAAFCLQVPATPDPNGALCVDTSDCCDDPNNCNLTCAGADPDNGIAGNCSPRPAPGFCSQFCATVQEVGGFEDAGCVDLSIGNIGGVEFFIPLAFPFDELFVPGTVTCTAEEQCTTAGEGCLPIGLAGIGDRNNGGICVPIADNAATAKAVGSACDPALNECLSGICADTDLDVVGQTECSALCVTNEDCAPSQVCAPVLLNDNNTAAAEDDTVIGLCKTIRPADVNDNCTSNQDCIDRADGSDTCDTDTGLCFNLLAVNGTACQTEADCPRGAECLGADPGNGIDGFCALSGCDSSQDGTASGCLADTDVCSANSVLDDLAPGTCLAGCTADADCQAINPDLTCQEGVCLP